MEDSIEKNLNNLKLLGVNVEAIERYYPRINESFVPLSVTGVSPRAYFHWKKEGLIDTLEDHTSENRTWVRLNLFQYIWIKIIKSMREFGLPLIAIKNAKELLFEDILGPLIKDKEDFIMFLKTESNYSADKIASIEQLLNYVNDIEALPEEYNILATQLGALIGRVLIMNDQVSLLIFKDTDGFEAAPFTYKSISDFSKQITDLIGQPHFQIPIKPLIAEFFGETKNEKVIEIYGFINVNEQKVIDAIRRNEFKEIVIRFKDPEREVMIIEEIIDHDIRDQKAKELKRIIGLNEFSEIQLKYRNDKHIFIRTKIRL